MTPTDQRRRIAIEHAIDAGESDGYPGDEAHDALADLMADVERLREIERAFNEGWLPEIPGERAELRLKALYRLRDLIPPASAEERQS